MIISASRRCDIPSYYSDWFINRLKEGYVLIPNPRNANRYSKVILTKDAVDCIVFWTKNPISMIPKLHILDEMGYKYYFQFTITPYGRDIEENLPDKNIILDTFKKLSDRLGTNRVVWRYDPIIINNKHSLDFHRKSFRYMAEQLNGYTRKCIISFVDDYKNVSKRMGYKIDYKMTQKNILIIADIFSKIASENNFELLTCSEEIDLSKFNINHASCIDKKMIEEIIGCKIDVKKDKNQRAACGCVESIEVGTYNCCGNGCNYCYANTSQKSVVKNMKMHNSKSPVLIGEVNKDAIITERDKRSIKITQLSLFD